LAYAAFSIFQKQPKIQNGKRFLESNPFLPNSFIIVESVGGKKSESLRSEEHHIV
jgi:hypothetical protein